MIARTSRIITRILIVTPRVRGCRLISRSDFSLIHERAQVRQTTHGVRFRTPQARGVVGHPDRYDEGRRDRALTYF